MTDGYLLDTNVVSELRKGALGNPGVRARFEERVANQRWLDNPFDRYSTSG